MDGDMPARRLERRTGYEWTDDDAGPVVRPYTLSGGRTQPGGRFDVLAFVVANVFPDSRPPARLQPEHHAILGAVQKPTSVAELASELDLALGVLRVLLGDLVAEDLVVVHEPTDGANRPVENVLEAVINGLRAL